MLENISYNKLKSLIGTVKIIDIRNKEDYDKGNIATSINIKNSDLMLYPEKYLDKSKKYYIYCQQGKTSVKTCIYLNRMGYKTINIIGGYDSVLVN